MLIEAVTLHRRFPYTVLVSVPFLDAGAATVGEVVGDAAVDDLQRPVEFGWRVGAVEGEQRRHDAVTELGVEHRERQPVVGQGVAVAAVDAADQPVQPQPAQVIACLGVL